MIRRSVLRGLLLLWLLCLPWTAAAQRPAAIPAFDSPVVDTTGTLDAAARRQLERQALALQQRTGSQLQVLVVPSTRPETIEQYAVRAFESSKLGRKGVDDGLLLVVAKDDRKVRIEVGYGLEGAIPDITAGRVIQEYMVPRFRQGDYAGGIVDASTQLVKLVDGEPLPTPVASNRIGADGDDGWLFALFAAFIASLIARSIFSGLPAGLRILFTAVAGGLVAWLLTLMAFVCGFGAVIGFFTGLLGGGSGGRYARKSDWGGFGGDWGSGGGSSGGDWGGSSGGGWSGGGGSSGGGGASGSW